MTVKQLTAARRRIAALLAAAQAIEDRNPNYNECPLEERKRHDLLVGEAYMLQNVVPA